MQFTAKRLEMLSMAKKAMKLANDSSPIEALRGIYLESDEDTQEISMITTNYEAVIFLKEKAAVTESGKLVINAKLLTEMLTLMSGEDAAFSSCNSGRQVKVSSGTCVYKAGCLTAADYPVPVMPFPEEAVKLSGICGLAKKTVFAVSKDNNKPALQCVWVKVKQDGARAASCDGMRLMMVKGAAESSGEKEFLLPARSFQTLASISADEDVFDVGVVGNDTVFTKKNMLFSIKKVDGSFIDANQIIQSVKPKYTAVAIADEVRGALDLVSIGAENEPVNIVFANHAVLIKRGGERSVSASEVQAKVSGDMPVKGFFYNLGFLTKLFAVVDGKVKLEMDEKGMMFIKTANEVYFQLPVRHVERKKEPVKKRTANKQEEAAA